MSVRRRSLGMVAAVVGVAAISAQAAAVTLLDDAFTDGSRTNQGLPDSAAWHFGTSAGGASISAASGSLVLSQPASGTTATLAATAYFTDAGAQPLGVGDSLTVQFDLLRTGSSTTSTADGLRFGLFDSGGSRLLADSSANNGASTAYNDWLGYMIWTNVGPSTSNSMTVRKRISASDTIVASAAQQQVGAAAAAGAIIQSTLYEDNALTITRTATGVVIDGLVAGQSISVIDDSGAYTAFDAFHIWFHNGPMGNGGTVALDNVQVTYIPEPASLALAGLGALAVLHRWRSANAADPTRG